MAFVPGLTTPEISPQNESPAAREVRVDEVQFQQYLDQALGQNAPQEGTSLSAPLRLHKTLNMLGGQFPPPDSGVGFLHVTIALKTL